MEVLREAQEVIARIDAVAGFNPCFNGSVERGYPKNAISSISSLVSILVLMEVLREVDATARTITLHFTVSILVLMEVLREEKMDNRSRPGMMWFQSLF